MKRKRDLFEDVKNLYFLIEKKRQICNETECLLNYMIHRIQSELLQGINILPFYIICIFELIIIHKIRYDNSINWWPDELYEFFRDDSSYEDI